MLVSSQTSDPVDLDVELGDWRLVGRVRSGFGNDRVVVQAGVVRAKHALGEWIRHLAWQSHGGHGLTRVIGKDGGIGFESLPSERAVRLLAELVNLYATGLQYPLVFFPGTSKAYAVAVRRAGEDADLEEVARRTFARNEWRDYEDTDAGRVRFGLPCPFLPWSSFGDLPIPEHAGPRELAVRVWSPALDHMVEVA